MRKQFGILAFSLFLTTAVSLSAQDCAAPAVVFLHDKTDTTATIRHFAFPIPANGHQLHIVPFGTPPSPPYAPPVSGSETTFEDLAPYTTYTVYVRSVCNTDTSDWVRRDFTTDLRNGEHCNIDIRIPDNNCDLGWKEISIYESSLSGALGPEVQLESVEIILEHSYPADIRMELESPSGVSVPLIYDHGTISDHFGDPGDTSCQLTTTFNSSACQSIDEGSPPFIGTFRPQGDFSNFYDSSNVRGEWKLKICDRAPDDVGTLRHLQLNFSTLICPAFPDPVLAVHPSDRADFRYEPTGIDSLAVLYSASTDIPDSVTDTAFTRLNLNPQDNQFQLSNLDFQSTYSLHTFIYCQGRWIGPGCPETFTTFCGPLDQYTDWEDQSTCTSACFSPCDNGDEIWQIPEEFNHWNFISGPTQTDFTGPQADFFAANGKYIYKESSDIACRDTESRLRSVCLRGTGNQCGLGLYFHMDGADVGTLLVLATIDEGLTYDTLLIRSGAMGQDWQFETLSLSQYDGQFQLVIAVGGSPSSFGDIALGDIILSGVEPVRVPDQLRFLDRDEDGYGDPDYGVLYCGSLLPDSLSNLNTDCNDYDPDVHPNATDQFCSGRDEDCDGSENYGDAEPLKLQIDSIGKVQCPGDSTGTLLTTPTGGIPPYQIEWSTGDTTFDLYQLAAGQYQLTITDSASCQTIERAVEITSERQLSFSFQILQRPSCPEPSEGMVHAQVSGGTPPYEYFWSNEEIGDTAFALPPGAFQLTVSDNRGCEYVSAIQQLGQTDSYSVTIERMNQVSCHGGEDGELYAAVQGGVPPIQFEWTTGDTTQGISNLPAGKYAVTATDGRGCIVSADSLTLAAPPPLELASIQSDPETCFEARDGRLSAKAIGGSPPYGYRWVFEGNKTFTGQTIGPLPPGWYALFISDQNGCEFSLDSIFVENARQIETSLLEIDSTSCPLSNNGEITVEIEGGVPPYQITWPDGVNNTNQRNDLSSGSYSLAVSDALGCKSRLGPYFVPKGQRKLEVTTELIRPLPCTSDRAGEIRSSIDSMAMPPIQYNWSQGTTFSSPELEDTLAIADPGQYGLTVTDAIGCVGKASPLKVHRYIDITIDSIRTTQPGCPDYRNGTIEVFASGPQAPFAFSWSNGQSGNILRQASAGTYHLTIEDQSPCKSAMDSFTLEGPQPIGFEVDTLFRGDDSVCFEIQNLSGGLAPLSTYINGNEERKICNALSELVELQIQDANGCSIDTVIWKGINAALTQNKLPIRLWPNPAFGESVKLLIPEPGHYQFHLYNSMQSELLQMKLRGGQVHSISLEQLPAGIYWILVKNQHGDQQLKKLILQN